MEEKVINAVKMCMSDKQSQKNVVHSSNLREELGYDSLDTMMLITELEAAFEININESDFTNVVTVSDIIENLKGAGIC